MTSSIKATVRGLTLIAALCGIGCATQSAIEVEQVSALRSVNGSAYSAPLKHDAPPSEQGVTFAVTHSDEDQGFSVKDVAPDELPQPVKKNAHGF